ncbi:MAG TPA: DUF302 domain-containing protein [Rhodopila sp.]|nr:DUF302 domain-containing protein [Rhodopila sp.]
MKPDGMIAVASIHDPAETTRRVERAVTARGITILARIDHAAAAAKVGLPLRPTEFLIFGNPKAGTPLMQEAQTIGIDLPLRALVWQDEAGQTWLGYNDPTCLARRHGADHGTERVLDTMAATLADIAREAATSVP